MAFRRSLFIFMLVAMTALVLLPAVRSADDSAFCPNSPAVLTPEDNCNIQCFVEDPVCGSNGVTYGCGCEEAHCNGFRVVKLGAC
ncbi:hypothetical protein DCAR_0519501 [Daucus carota subsp. sativus]|uniref:Kazal-like domain-containing protein n=1 Tax=Daucus carota subsp. sativus TaxID=79200 RepID=A0A162A1Q4_DAUCS|nr:hypothetical protein DCAR_0519501 [Daucus carota subsp. sativus]